MDARRLFLKFSSRSERIMLSRLRREAPLWVFRFGGHFNPAVTLGLWAGGRCMNKHVIPYLMAEVVGAVLAVTVLWVIASGKPDWVADGYGNLSPGKYGLAACSTAPRPERSRLARLN